VRVKNRIGRKDVFFRVLSGGIIGWRVVLRGGGEVFSPIKRGNMAI